MKTENRLSRKMFSHSLLLGVGASLFLPGVVEARLIFTTEADGVNADGYHIDNDDSSFSDVDLFFGGPLSDAFIRYDKLADKFFFSKDLDLQGNELLNFVIHNSDDFSMPTCTAANTGQIYYSTDSDQILFCGESADTPGTYVWMSNQDNSITTKMIHADVAGLGLVQDGDGSLKVNTDNSTLELNGDEVRIKEQGVTSLEIANDTIIHEDIATGAVRSDEILDETITFDDIAARSAVDVLNPEFQNSTIWADPGEEHVGTMEADYEVLTDRNFYKWWTTKGNGGESEQKYYLILKYTLPENFVEWEATNQILIDMKTEDDELAHNRVNISLMDIDQDQMVLSGATNLTSGVLSGGWSTKTISFDPNQLDATWLPSRDITLRVQMVSKATWAGSVVTPHPVWIGKVQMRYKVK